MFFEPVKEGEDFNIDLIPRVESYFSSFNGRILIIADDNEQEKLGKAIITAAENSGMIDKEFKLISINEFSKQLHLINTIADLKDKLVHDVHYNQIKQFFRDLIREDVNRSDIIFILNFEADDPKDYSDLLIDTLIYTSDYCSNKPIIFNENNGLFNKCGIS